MFPKQKWSLHTGGSQAHPAIDDVFYLAYTLFFKNVWMSCQHLKLRKFHIKSTFLISLKIRKIWTSWAHILKWQRCGESKGQLCPSHWMWLPAGLPPFSPSPLESLPLPTSPCRHLGLEPPTREGAQKRKYFLTKSLPVWNLIYWWTKLSYTRQSPEFRDGCNEFNLVYKSPHSYLIRNKDYFEQS